MLYWLHTHERNILMKKILIFSDTHGHTDPCIYLINNTPHVDAVIHAGDYTRDAEDLEYIFPELPIFYVKGNNDLLSRAPSELTTIIGGARIFITHGHEQRVKYDTSYSTLRAHAAKSNPALVVFGHTHVPYTSYDGGFITLNPGSVRFSKTYAIAEIDNGKVKTQILDI